MKEEEEIEERKLIHSFIIHYERIKREMEKSVLPRRLRAWIMQWTMTMAYELFLFFSCISSSLANNDGERAKVWKIRRERNKRDFWYLRRRTTIFLGTRKWKGLPPGAKCNAKYTRERWEHTHNLFTVDFHFWCLFYWVCGSNLNRNCWLCRFRANQIE